MGRIAIVIFNGTDYVGFREGGSRSIKIAGLEYHVEGHSRLGRQDAVEAPTVGEALQTSLAIRELVDEIPREAIADIEVGVASV